MALTVWTQPSGYILGTLNERQTVNISLPVSTSTGITFTVITGKLPPGLRIVGSTIVGTPFEVPRTTEFKFVIRASKGVNISDRTFVITIVGADEPQWLQPEGPLPVGTNNAYYILDSSFIDFQLNASDTDTASGQRLQYFIASDDGELPPGLVLTDSGRITGFVQPLLAIPLAAGEGKFDEGLYDQVAYDFGYRPNNGYDTYVFDLTVFDFSVPTGRPRKLNRNYEFVVTITDGDTITKRKFRIFVVGDDFFRADNIITSAGTGAYTADVTYVRAPIFTTANYLGLRRANNYQTFKIDIYEGFTDLGPVAYQFSEVNSLVNAIAIKEVPTDNRIGSSYIRIEKSSNIPLEGYKINMSGDITGATGETYTITDVDVLGGDIYRLTVTPALEFTIPNGSGIFMGTDSILPPGMEFDETSGEVFGVVPYQPAVTKNFQFTIKAIRFGQGGEQAVSRRVFNVDILGEVESTMNWESPDNLGIIDSGYISTLSVKANTTLSTSAILYTLESGRLPNGLSLNLDGEIVGKVNQSTNSLEYRSFWKPSTFYEKDDIIKRTNFKNIKSIIRRRNTATLVTDEDHGFTTGDIVKIQGNVLEYNYYQGIEITADPITLLSVNGTPVNETGWRVKFNIDTQTLQPLAFTYTSIAGTPVNYGLIINENATVTATSGTGVGARFWIKKVIQTVNPLDPQPPRYQGLTTIKLVDPGSGYLPGDTYTISGSQLGGVDGVNDLTFTSTSGLEFYYKINGNSNSNYNGRFLAVESTTSTLTLLFDQNPGSFGSGTISVETSPGVYTGKTFVTPLNYFSYYNSGITQTMQPVTGVCQGEPEYYRSRVDHTSGITFTTVNWIPYDFPDEDQSVTSFDQGSTTFDGNTSSYDRTYKFTIRARDQLGYSAITKTFTITVNTPNNTYYSNLFVRPFMKIDQRQSFKDFITDSSVFNPRLIYRPNDPNFGIQTDLSMLVFAGIETKEAVEYISAIGRNHKTKRFKFGQIKKAEAKAPGTNEVIYEVVYIEMIDPLEKNGKYLPETLKYSRTNVNITVDNTNEFYNGPFDVNNPFWKRPMPLYASIDRNDIFAGDPATGIRFPSSISLWRYRIRSMPNTLRERNYLPLWMRTIQTGSTQELNYVPAVPLCYCKPGQADTILLNIKNNGFDFKLLDYTIDRYTIDSVEGDYTDKYLVFRNDRTTIT